MLLDTPVGNLGLKAQDFALDDAHGTRVTLNDAMGEKGLLVAFICNHCPYVKAIADRLATDAKALMADGIGVVAINSNDPKIVPEDSPPNMIRFAEQHGFGFPYVIDADQKVAETYGAVCTPDFFGFNADGELQYRGRLDSAGMNDPTGRTPELVNAMRAIAESGKGPAEQHPSMGCSIKWS